MTDAKTVGDKPKTTNATASPKPAKKAVKKGTKSSKRKSGNANVGGTKGLPWTFPKHTLEDAIQVAKAIEDKNAGNPMPALSIAIAVRVVARMRICAASA